ncbi:hypothetical protein FS749_013908 [Ceratobasidium sp. UAMH 11750]|nr:hypothetical protein FS749_013908 [Ceratobasidium sp. UAMH 11750]
MILCLLKWLYVLQVGKGEDEGDKKLKGYEHQWTFPRQFHVSPFNDRSGHYVCSVVMPSHPPPSDAASESAPTTTPPRPIINLHLHTAPPSPRLKLTALLRPVVSEPLTARTLVSAIFLPPPASWFSLPLGAALFLTAFRIVYHAARLHYQHNLAVFARPEPIAGAGREWVEKALGGVWNDVQPTEAKSSPHEDEDAAGGSIGWQAESSTEQWARKRFEMRFGAVAARLGLCIKIASVDPSVPITTLEPTQAQANDRKSARELMVCYRSPRTWSCLLLAPTAQHALQLGSRVEKWFAVSDEQLFIDLWNGACPSKDLNPTWILKPAKAIRSHFARVPDTTPTHISLPSPPYPLHPLDSPPSFALLFHVCLLYLTFHAERIVFSLMRARFVRGDAPWKSWDRLGREARVGAGGIGSIVE